MTTARAQLAMDKLMDAAERLYAEHGFAGVSIRQICAAAGQRNNSVVQYHFSSRDELIKAIIDRHVLAVDEYRMALMGELAGKPEVSLRDRVSCLVLPSVLHNIDLGTPSWHARFMAQALVEPSLREYTIQAHTHDPDSRAGPELGAMIRQVVVHMCAELEYDLAHHRIAASAAESSWHRLGDHLVTAVCGMSIEFRAKGR
ncbi:MAG TPA: helix-turn-helix domain-containing protein [Pseudonocardiaceae bacterium]|jgi:AcrR family transcriptional regulator|nr:helix-turn-helix domain-containing protein [Pseudonocardiaceae bacterium]